MALGTGQQGRRQPVGQEDDNHDDDDEQKELWIGRGPGVVS